MEAQEENVLWRAKAKQNKTVTTQHENKQKKELFDSFAILQSLLLINRDEIFTPSQSENNKNQNTSFC